MNEDSIKKYKKNTKNDDDNNYDPKILNSKVHDVVNNGAKNLFKDENEK
jgi:hypothetical protein